jgi:glycosyltransferase involved in cell wall biosynthesis
VNVIYDTGVDLSHTGGAVTHILEKAAALGRRDIAVEVWAHRKPGVSHPSAVHVRQFAAPLRRPVLRQLSYLAYEACAAWALLREPRVGTVLLARQRIFGASVLICARLRRIPVVYEVNDDVFDQLGLAGELSRTKRRVVGALLEAGARQANSVLALTPQLKNLCIERYDIASPRIHVVPVGCDLTRFTPMDKKTCKASIGLDPDCRYLVNVSSFTPWSGIDLAIRLMPMLLAEEPKLRLLLVGDGATMKAERALADELGVSGAVVFVGSVPYERVPLYVNAADACFCVKSEELMTTSPTRLYEYLGCGKVAFVTKGYKRTVPTDALIEVSARDLAGSTATILELLTDETKLGELEAGARAYAVAHAGWDAVAEMVARVLVTQPAG